jgi:glutathionylspermidine synthase
MSAVSPNLPWHAGVSLPAAARREVRERTIFEHCKWDPQVGDVSVLHPAPLLLRPEAWREIARLAEAMHEEVLGAEAAVVSSAEALATLGLPACLRRALGRAGAEPVRSARLRVSRFDFHHTREGWRVSEVNSDVPGGYIEAAGFASAMAAHTPGARLAGEPAAALVNALRELAPRGGPIGLVHATAYTDDRQVMVFLARRLAAAGLSTELLAPDSLRWREGRAELRDGRVLDAVFRFFPAEWLPNLGLFSGWSRYTRASPTPQCNPVAAIVSQSKRFPLACRLLGLRLPTWDALVPETRDPREVPASEADAWVLKPALGRVGEGIGLAGATEARELAKIRREARRHPRQWAAQRRFDAVPWETDEGPRFPCLGVYVIDGRAAGVYGRVAARPLIDSQSQDVAVLLAPEPARDPPEARPRPVAAPDPGARGPADAAPESAPSLPFSA